MTTSTTHPKMTTVGDTSGTTRTPATAPTPTTTVRTNNSSSSDQIEAKMYTALAAVRKERDTARRNYELAVERLALLRGQVQTAETTVQERSQTLTALQHDRKTLEERILPLRQSVNQLKQEAEYQHAEVVTKQQKKNTMGHDLHMANMKRQEQIQALEAMIAKRRSPAAPPHERRGHPAHKDHPTTASPSCLVHELVQELEEHDDTTTTSSTTELVQLLPDLIIRKTKRYDTQTAQLQQEVMPRYRAVLQGYQTKFGGTATTTTAANNNDAVSTTKLPRRLEQN